MTFQQAVHEVAQAAIECGEHVVENDPDGHCVTVDLYALGLDAARRAQAHPVRVLTGAIDLLWGLRDYCRGEKEYIGDHFGTSYIGDIYNWSPE